MPAPDRPIYVRGVSRVRTLGAVRKLMAAEGWEEAPDGGLQVRIAASGDWTAVLDAGDRATALARGLSEALHALAVVRDDEGGVQAFERGAPSGDPAVALDLPDVAGVTDALRLVFRRAGEPTLPDPWADGGGALGAPEAPDPAALHPGGHRAALRGTVGEVLLATIRVPTLGGPGTGVGVHVWGEAAELVHVHRVEVEGHAAVPEWWDDADEGDAWLEAELPAAPIPAASALEAGTLPVRVEIGLARAGGGVLELAIAPLEGEGAFHLTWDVEIRQA